MSPRHPLVRPLYESLPLLYGFAGLGAGAAGYFLHRSVPWLSVLLSLAGLAGLLAGLVIWLRRRDYRRLQAGYRVHGLDEDLDSDRRGSDD